MKATILLVVVFCSITVPAQRQNEKALSVDDQIRYVVLSDKLNLWTRSDSGVSTICIAVDEEKDPSESLLDKLHHKEKSVKPRSGCYLEEGNAASKDSSTNISSSYKACRSFGYGIFLKASSFRIVPLKT